MTLITASFKNKIEKKIEKGQRLTPEEGLALFQEPDLEWLGRLANAVREAKHGNRTTYVINVHLNYSNICTLSCMFCAFARKAGQTGAYEMSLAEMINKVSPLSEITGAEVHIVGGLHPDFPYEYYPRLLTTLKEYYPKVHLKAFTAVEIDYFAGLKGKDVDWVLRDLKEAGLDSMPGGGAEILSERVHRKLYRDKIGPERWLEIHRVAHRLGIPTSATMLFGHIETLEERVEHLCKLRELQDEMGGFLAFIPLRFHPDNTPLRKLPLVDEKEVLRNVAVSRLMLDNFPHIKAYWVMSGLATSQQAQWMGADDFDGTVVEEKITHMAGCETPVGVTESRLRALIEEAGREPRRRDALYRLVESG